MSHDRVHLLAHAAAGAIEVGIAGRPHRMRGHAVRRYEPIAERPAPATRP
ncbi:hypothetical protein [Geodermatophilus siccatus]|nr:hypothetical protein [Geodermatophilus siccatus]